MSHVHPFRGLRPKPELAAQVASPPYDVLNSEEARKMAEGNELSFLHVVKPEIDLDPGIDLYDDRVYEKGAENFKKLRESGAMIQDPKPCFYLYQQRWKDHVQTGLVAGASIDEYENDLIKKHELTRPDKEADRIRHIDTLNAQAGPVFLTYKARDEITALLERAKPEVPTYDFTADDGVGHTFWVVERDEDIKAIQQAFGEVDRLYVADGHHRSASATAVRKKRQAANPGHTGEEEYNYFLTVIFPHDEMKILAYNRVVQDLAGLDNETFLKKLAKWFTHRPTDEPEPPAPHSFGLYHGQKWYRMDPKAGSFDPTDPVRNLDVSILQENLLSPVLGIEDPRKDKRIDFVGGIRGTGELERRCREGWALAVAMYPTTIDQLMSVADAGLIMPPKSTWFEPKLRSGLVVHLLD
jgi:uncharacterized protein (DUF1015 family)